MVRLRVKDHQHQPGAGAGVETRRLALCQLVYDSGFRVHRVFKAGTGFVILADDHVIEDIVESGNAAKFKAQGFEPLEPPELNAKRTIVLTGVDTFISMHNNQDIAQEIERSNPTLKVSAVVKLPRSKTVIKVRLENVAMVQLALTKGMLIFSQSFPSNFLAQDVYIYIPQCMRCYSYEHTKKDCPKSEDYLICSNCSNEGHRYTSCSNVFTKCLSCQGDHPTMVARCPTRRAFTKTKSKEVRDQSRARGSASYANVTSTPQQHPNISPQANNNAWGQPPLKQTVIINTAIIMANLREAVRKGSFQSTFDSIMKGNGLPTVVIPDEVLTDTESINDLLQGKTPNVNANKVNNTGFSQEAGPSNINVSPFDDTESMDDDYESGKRTRSDISDDETSSRPPPTKVASREGERDPQQDSNTAGAEAVGDTPTEEEEVVPASTETSVRKKKKKTLKSLGFQLWAKDVTKLGDNSSHETRLGYIRDGKIKFQFTGQYDNEDIKERIMAKEIDLSTYLIQRAKEAKFNKIKTGYYNLNNKN